MAEKNSDFLDFLSQNDPLGLLKKQPKAKQRSEQTVLLRNFEEVVNFFEEHEREPKSRHLIYMNFNCSAVLKPYGITLRW
ncbi:hypothetical protein HMPREF2890_04375 [Porphyromonas sp. HMSC065F10]|nr:hypothetical protein HMPREF2890_04375 [Porphyromonas sp. HMSC065F10]